VASGATLAIYMPGRRYDRVAADLLSAHLDPETPCLIVSRASLPAERVTDTTVGALALQAGLPAPAILLVGPVVRRGDGAAGRERSSISLSDR
jgi:siroheme synthase